MSKNRNYAGKYKSGVRNDYAQDSTKGGALVTDPRTFKKDTFVQVWLESRKLEALSEWIDNNVVRTKFLSEVVRESLDVLVESLEESGEIMVSNDTIESIRYLEDKYRININKSVRAGKNRHHNIMLTEKIRNRGDALARSYEYNQREEVSENSPAQTLVEREETLVERAARMTEIAMSNWDKTKPKFSRFEGIKDTSAIMTQADILKKRQEAERVTREGITDEDLIRQNEEDVEELRLMNEAMCNVPAELVVEDKIVK